MFQIDFFTRVQTTPPPIKWWWYLPLLVSVFALIYCSYRYYKKASFRRFFIGLQIFQLVSLYSWYAINRIGLEVSLPLYHCRMAMLGLLLLPKGRAKQFMAQLGLVGALLALGYPVFDPYDFPHLTTFSFILGHYALLVNSLVYLFSYYTDEKSWRWDILLGIPVINLFLIAVNRVTGGSYGMLSGTPFISQEPLIVRYLAVTLVLILSMWIVDGVIRKVAYGLK